MRLDKLGKMGRFDLFCGFVSILSAAGAIAMPQENRSYLHLSARTSFRKKLPPFPVIGYNGG